MNQINLHDFHLIERYIRDAETKMLFDSLTEQKFIKLYKVVIAYVTRKT